MPVRKCPKHIKISILCEGCGDIIKVRKDYISLKHRNGKKILCRSCSCKRYKDSKVKTLSNLDRAYLAGMIDADGCITWSDTQPQVNITNCCLEMLTWVSTTVGCGSILLHQKKIGNWNVNYKWVLCGRKSIKDFLTQIIPYLKVKQMKAQETINKCP